MQVVRAGDGAVDQGTTFTGETWRTTLVPTTGPAGTQVNIVRFVDGARTHWHTHPGDQVLYILEGHGRVGTADGEWLVGPGDVVYAPGGERHWHGAVAGQGMTHLTIASGGTPEWHEAPAE